MELRQRKRINNLPKFNPGKSGSLDALDAKVNPNYQSDVVKDLTNMIGSNAPNEPSFKQYVTNRLSNNNPSNYTPSGSHIGAGGGISADTVTGAVNGTIGMMQGYNSMQNAVKGTDELMAYSGQRTDQSFGVNYQAQNDINRQKAMDDISKSNRNATLGMVGSGAAAGAAIGSVVPGVGTLIGGAAGAVIGLFGGLFGSKKARERQRRKIFNAQQKVNLINQVNQSSAATEGLTQQYYLDNGNTYDDVLYANRGKDLRKPRYVKCK